MKTSLAIVAALSASATMALGAASGIAQDAPEIPGVVDVSRIQAGSYATDPAHTVIQWEVDHFGFNPYFGLFGDVEGTMAFDPANVEATTLDVSIPVTSLAVVSSGLREHMLRPGKDGGSPDFFGPTPPAAKFTTTDVRQIGGTSAVATGDLTLNGQTREVSLLVEFTGAGKNPVNETETIGFTATTDVERSDFGIGYAIPMVSDTVELTITAAFERQP